MKALGRFVGALVGCCGDVWSLVRLPLRLAFLALVAGGSFYLFASASLPVLALVIVGFFLWRIMVALNAIAARP